MLITEHVIALHLAQKKNEKRPLHCTCESGKTVNSKTVDFRGFLPLVTPCTLNFAAASGSAEMV